MHLVVEMTDQALIDWGVPECEGNPEQLSCISCKGFKAYGICSHVLAVNHIRRAYNVRYMLRKIGKSKAIEKRKGGAMARTGKPPPALQKMPEREPDSSDEEEERLLALGQQGR